MSVPYKIEAMQELLVGAGKQGTASERIPAIAKPFVSERAKKTLDLVCDVPLAAIGLREER